MKIVIASSLEQGEAAFSALGEVRVLDESAISRQDLLDADALIVRSKTRLDAELLRDTPVRFAATATAGVDHVDQAWLAKQGIEFYAAYGCNATAVTEYVFSALLNVAAETGRPLPGRTLGIVGVGQVGSRLAKKAKALGLECLLNDPPRVENEGLEGFHDLDTVLAESDLLSFHVPLIDEGPWPTRNLLTPERLKKLKPGALVVNACRGEISTESAWMEAVDSGCIGTLVLDVFPEEPEVSDELLSRCRFATPHIAGHSFEGKLNGTLQCREACRAFFHVDPKSVGWVPIFPEPIQDAGAGDSLQDLFQAVYDIREDDRRFREALHAAPGNGRKEAFHRLRRTYPLRFEASHHRLGKLDALHRAFGFLGPE